MASCSRMSPGISCKTRSNGRTTWALESLNCPLCISNKEGSQKMVGYIEPKPTNFRGETFRSRLEARWAVFLHLYPGISQWGYETHRMCLQANRKEDAQYQDTYTPDFSLVCDKISKGLTFLEVKPVRPNKDYLKRLGHFTRISNAPILVGFGSFYNAQPLVGIVSDNGRVLGCKPLSMLFPKSTGAIKAAGQYRFDL